MNELCDFIKDNKELIENTKGALYNRNDNVGIRYPVNMVDMNVTVEENESGRIENSMKIARYKFGKDEKEKELIKKEGLVQTSTSDYGLYFPLLMNFRQNVELAYKLIYVNEILKKDVVSDRKELEVNHAKKISEHNLISLLKMIQQYIEDDVFDFLWKLSSFIYYSEGTDATFSRYIVDRNLNFDDIGKITIYYVDLENYINEFYGIMDYVFSKMNFGFDIETVIK